MVDAGAPHGVVAWFGEDKRSGAQLDPASAFDQDEDRRSGLVGDELSSPVVGLVCDPFDLKVAGGAYAGVWAEERSDEPVSSVRAVADGVSHMPLDARR